MGDVNSVYNAYMNKQMTPEDEKQYYNLWKTGNMALPAGVQALEPYDTRVQTPVVHAQSQAAPQAQQITPQVTASQPASQAPPEKMFDDWKTGSMSPEDADTFVKMVNSKMLTLDDLQLRVFESKTQQDPLKYADETGLIEDIGEQITGDKRKTEQSEAAKDWYDMPELSLMSVNGIKTLLGTIATDPEETMKIIKNNNPDVNVSQDEKGNYIFTSKMDGKKYAIKPGLQWSDAKRAAAVTALFGGAAIATGGMGPLAMAGGAMALQTGIEGSQVAQGGTFDVAPIIGAGLTEFGGSAIARAPSAVKGLASRTPSATQTAVKQAEKIGIVPPTSTVLPPETYAGKLGQAIGERIPITGTGKKMAKLQKERVAAIKSTLEDFGAGEVDDSIINSVSDDLLKTRGAYIKKNVDKKTDVINRLSKEEVNVENATKAFDTEISTLNKLGTKEAKSASKILEDYKQAIQGKNLGKIELIRKEFGNKLKNQDLATIKSTYDKQFDKLYKSINDDMGDYIKANGEKGDYSKWRVANNNLSKGIGDLESSVLKAALKKGSIEPEKVSSLLFSKKPSQVKLLFKNLSPEGKKNAKTALLMDVYKKSGDVEGFSPARFYTNLNKMIKKTDIILSGEEKEALKGLNKALKLTERANVANVKPVTGSETATLAAFSMPSALAYFTGVSPAVGLGAGFSIGGMARMYESRPVRRILLQLAKSKPGKEKYLIKALGTAVQSYRQTESGKKNIKKILK